MKFIFFGSSDFSVYVLDELKLHHLLPSLIVTTPDKPKGRKLILTPTPTKIWGRENGIEVIDPPSLRKPSIGSKNSQQASSGQASSDLIPYLVTRNSDLFLVASYGKIIPKEIFEIPPHKTLNIHPSLLPKYRGASPIASQILNDEKEIGVSIMQIDEGMDTGPIVAKKELRFLEQNSMKSLASATGASARNFLEPTRQVGSPTVNVGAEKYPWISEDFAKEIWPLSRTALEKTLAIEGARLFAHVVPEWVQGVIQPIMQNEDEATYCKKITKEDGKLDIDLNDLSKNARQNFLKIKAFEEWPTAYFFLDTPKFNEGGPTSKRIIITDAAYENDSLKILKVIPEGKKEMPFEDFLRGIR